jgi:hypothetical protein
MEPTEYRDCVDAAVRLERPWNRLLVPEGLVRTRFGVEAAVLGDNAPEVILTEDEDVVEHLSAERTDEAFSEGIHVRRAYRRAHDEHPRRSEYASEPSAELRIVVADDNLSDGERAQQISDQFPSVDWVRVLGRYARRINPLLGELLRPMQYYWVTAQAEYSTDVLFRKRKDLHDLMPRLLEYSALYFGAKDVMSSLGRKLVGQFRGELVTDHRENDLAGKRLPGRRVSANSLRQISRSGFRIRCRWRQCARHVF